MTPVPRCAASPVLVASSVAFTYVNASGRAVAAVARVDLDLYRGEVVAVVGVSGSGKTTLLEVLAGLRQPTFGSVQLAPDARLGFAFQQPTLLDWYNIRDNVALGMFLAGRHSLHAARGPADACLQRVGLAGREASFPWELSQGMRMRANLARALVGDPTILLLDEPFAALDEPARFLLAEELQPLFQGGDRAAILVSHNIREAVALATRVVVLAGPPAAVRAEYTVPANEGVPFAERANQLPVLRLADEIRKQLTDSTAP